MNENKKYDLKEMRENSLLRKSIKKRRKRLKKIIIFLVIGFGIFAEYYFGILPARRKNESINPEIYLRFREIENHCSSYLLNEYVSQRELEKCEQMIDVWQNCSNSEFCPADYYYEQLHHLGFSLPPFYLE